MIEYNKFEFVVRSCGGYVAFIQLLDDEIYDLGVVINKNIEALAANYVEELKNLYTYAIYKSSYGLYLEKFRIINPNAFLVDEMPLSLYDLIKGENPNSTSKIPTHLYGIGLSRKLIPAAQIKIVCYKKGIEPHPDEDVPTIQEALGKIWRNTEVGR